MIEPHLTIEIYSKVDFFMPKFFGNKIPVSF